MEEKNRETPTLIRSDKTEQIKKKDEPWKINIGEIKPNEFYYFPDNSKQKIYVNINSTGGCLETTAYLMYRLLSAKPRVITENMGQCLSGGFFVFICGDERISFKHGLFLFHGGAHNGYRPVSALKDYLDKTTPIIDFTCRRLAKISTKSFSYWNHIVQSDKDVFFTAQELKKIGIVTKIW